MTAGNFATQSKTGPNPCTTAHVGGLSTSYTCHMAAMHWAFMDLGDTGATANARIAAIIRATCPGCIAGAPAHGSIQPVWYGANFCTGGNKIDNRDALFGAVDVGDILILPDPRMPMHTMVVVKKSTGCFGGESVYIRGFNNTGTLGTGAYLAYDNANRDIDKASLWRTDPSVVPIDPTIQVFGNGGGSLYVIPYAAYSANAVVIRNRCANAAGVWTFV